MAEYGKWIGEGAGAVRVAKVDGIGGVQLMTPDGRAIIMSVDTAKTVSDNLLAAVAEATA